jgi:hypothetical protein
MNGTSSMLSGRRVVKYNVVQGARKARECVVPMVEMLPGMRRWRR